MTYVRVIPRDLFNEGNLLTCLGRLSIKLEDRSGHRARLDLAFQGGGFVVAQDESDGSISCRSVMFIIGTRPTLLFRPLNARDKWPLYARVGDEDVRVFDLDGALSHEFVAVIGGTPVVEDDDSYPPACSDPGGHEWPAVEEGERCLCVHCGADGDA